MANGSAFTLDDITLEFAALWYAGKTAAEGNNSTFTQVQVAATKAIRQAGIQLKDLGRANIRGAGFSSKWANAWRVNIYPAKGFSIDAAAFGFHKIGYADIFETGGSIQGKKGLLWVPLATVPKGSGGHQISARAMVREGVKLFTIKRPGKKPLLASSVRVTKAFNNRKSPAVSFTKLRAGGKGKKGKLTAVPLYIGLPAVTLRKRFELASIASRVQSRLGDLYFANIEG